MNSSEKLSTHLNYFPMGFETHHMQVRTQQTMIWTISLWDLKLQMHILKLRKKRFELFPYGIWNIKTWKKQNPRIYLNYFPMGFETDASFRKRAERRRFELFPYGIWNYKYRGDNIYFKNLNYFPMGFETFKLFNTLIPVLLFELFPYGIWNWRFRQLSLWRNTNLNYFPMGFETGYDKDKPLPNGIWTISLWDLKHRQTHGHTTEIFNLNYFPMGFETT